mmetsp:Transcript_75525/g.177335  ORF Transcript_75525/g.177335 Transcript_75525/m.177335 type:complete len:264 (-) Transcript_75525:67-858(-)
MVLDGELEVGEGNRDERRDDDQDDKDEQQDPVERVELVTPDGGEDVVELDVDGAEREEAGHEDLCTALAVEGEGGDLPGDLGGAARCLERGGPVATSDTTDDGEGEGDKGHDEDDDDDGAEGQGGGRLVGHGHKVEEGPNHEERAEEEKPGKHSAPHPVFPSKLLEQRVRCVATHDGGECVKQDRRDEEATTVARVKHAEYREQEDAEGKSKELCSIANDGAEGCGVHREPEDVSVDELPPRFLSFFCRFFLLGASVACEIVL